MTTPSKFEILEYETKYTDQIIDLITKVLKSLSLVPESKVKITDSDLYKISSVYKDRGKFWVAIFDGNVIGTVAIRDLDDGTAILNRMFVLTEYHGGGVGQKLLDTAIAFAKSMGYKRIILNTSVLMKRAHCFYEKNGFEKIITDAKEYHYELKL